MGEYKPTPMETVIAIARGDAVTIDALTATDVSELGAEIIRHRRAAEREERRAMEVRKLRWMIETVAAKAEDLADVESLAMENKVAGRIAKWIRGYGDEAIDAELAASGIEEGKWR